MKPTNNNTPAHDEQTTLAEFSEFDVRSAEVQEIIGRPPHGLIRWGITAFFGVLLVIVLSAWFVKYPDSIHASLRLTAINAPKMLHSKVNGKLVKLCVPNKTRVQKGQVLAWLESTASHREVLRLSEKVDQMQKWLQKNKLVEFKSIHLAGFSDLGELQTQFQSFEQSFRDFTSYLPGGYYNKKREILEQKLSYTRGLLEKLKEQKRIQQSDYQLARQEFEAQKKLAGKKLVAPLELAQQKSKLNGRRLPLQQTASAIIRNQAEQADKKQQLMELEKQIQDHKSSFTQAVYTLKSAIEDWENKYLIQAPLAGTLIYSSILQENQSLANGEEVFLVQPENTRFFGEMAISQASFGKIREGQPVLVRFSGYPYQEFGSVRGNIGYLSGIPVKDSLFLAKVNFPRGLQTNYGRKLPPTNGMMGRAEIITRDMRLLQRFYNNIARQLQ